MSAPAKAFRSSNRSSMGSNVYTTQAQGGGAKKAGFAHQIGREHWTSTFIQACNPSKQSDGKPFCANLKCLQYTVNPNVCQSRPISSLMGNSPNTYFHCRGTR
jgi:hypothetical protein